LGGGRRHWRKGSLRDHQKKQKRGGNLEICNLREKKRRKAYQGGDRDIRGQDARGNTGTKKKGFKKDLH